MRLSSFKKDIKTATIKTTIKKTKHQNYHRSNPYPFNSKSSKVIQEVCVSNNMKSQSLFTENLPICSLQTSFALLQIKMNRDTFGKHDIGT